MLHHRRWIALLRDQQRARTDTHVVADADAFGVGDAPRQFNTQVARLISKLRQILLGKALAHVVYTTEQIDDDATNNFFQWCNHDDKKVCCCALHSTASAYRNTMTVVKK